MGRFEKYVKWSALRPGRFSPTETFSSIHCMEGRFVRHHFSGRIECEKYFLPLPKIEPHLHSRSVVTIATEM